MEMEELDKFFDYDTILQRMLDNVSNNVDKREGSIIYDAVAPCAAELAQMYIELKNDIDLVFMDTAVEQYLDRLANQIGIVRKEATKAIKSGSFYDENDTLMDIELNIAQIRWYITLINLLLKKFIKDITIQVCFLKKIHT